MTRNLTLHRLGRTMQNINEDKNLNETKKMLTKQNTQKNGSLKTGKLKNNNKLKTTQ